ncbi:MAG TPA: ankyrin repeat domain-containing protein [Desulfomonilaceae bacterium]|nr:ankyrin repeat domain-containing protein [Desulfomonilaceae bacterium]
MKHFEVFSRPKGSRSGAKTGLMVSICGLLLASCLFFPQVTLSSTITRDKSGATLTERGTGDLYALVVGVSKYRDAKVPKLEYSDKDAKAFGEFLETQKEIFKETNVTYLLNEKATKSEVEKYLYYTLPKAGKSDTVILFFSGHGAYDPLRPKEFLFLPYDTEPKYLGTSAVKMSGLEFLKGIEAGRVLIIADACYAGGFSEGNPKSLAPSLELFRQEIRNSSGRAIITSGREEELSWELPNRSNSVFTRNLLLGLKGKADKNNDGIVTLRDAYEYAYQKTREETNGHQHPQIEEKVVGAFPLSYVGPPVPAPEVRRRMFHAAKSGDSAEMEQLLAGGADVNSRDENNDTALIVSARQGQSETVELLLGKKGVDVDATNHSRATALFAACGQGHTDTAKLLLEAGANVNFKSSDGFTPLAATSREGYLETAKLLLAHGADIKARTDNGKTPLNLASSRGHADVVKLLLENGANAAAIDLDGRTALTEAARGGHAEIVQLLLDKKAGIAVKNARFLDKQLILTSLQGDRDRMKELLAIGASVNAETTSGDTALTLAAGLGDLKTIKLLISHSANVNFRMGGGVTPLLLTANAGRQPVVQLLLASGAYPGDKDKDGNTALCLAARNGHAETVRTLLTAQRTEVDARNLMGRTALMLAAEYGYSDVVKLLLASAGDINAVDQDGNSALILCSENGHEEIVRLLLNKEASVNARNNKGVTALISAVKNGHKSVVKLLLGKGADIAAEDWEGKSAVTLAAERGIPEIVELLKKR